MKLTIKYETEEIKALIREDLVRQGISAAADATIVFKKDHAVIEVEASREGVLEAAPITSVTSVVEEKAAAAPPLEVVEGGAQAVDMSEVFSTSARLAQTEKGKYPPRERELMEGESYEHPFHKPM